MPYPAAMPPELAKLLQPLVVRWEVGMARVAGAYSASRRAAFPDASIEQLLQHRFSSLPAEKQTASKRRADRAMAAKGKITRRAARFLNIDLTSPEDAARDADPRAVDGFQLSTQDKKALQGYIDQLVTHPKAPAPGGGQAAPNHSTLALRFRRMLCVDETNGLFGSEWGSDEMLIGSTAIDTNGVISKVARINLYKNWDDGDDRPYPTPKVIARVGLQGKNYPLTAVVTMIMAEDDSGGGLETIVNRIYDRLAQEARRWLLDNLGKGFPDVLLGWVLAYLVDRIISKLKSYWDDDLFRPVTIQITLPSQNATFNGKNSTPSRKLRFSGPGEYFPSYEWVLS